MEEKERKSYPSGLTDEQWEDISPLIYGDAQLYVEQRGIDGCRAVFGRFRVQMETVTP